MDGEVNPSKHRLKKKNTNKKSRNAHLNPAKDRFFKRGGQTKNNQKKASKGHPGSVKDGLPANSSKAPHNNTMAPKSSKRRDPSKQTPILRKRVDPETAKYFLDIANLFESNGLDLEDHSTICGNALEETRGKEVELASDAIISHTLQRLLKVCDLDQLCGFLRNCSKGFPSIVTDKFGSHVAETALKSLSVHLQDEGSYSIIEETLHKICQEVVVNAVEVMCNRYGSHVLRSLLCLCKGVPLDSMEEFHVTKRSAILAERLNCRPVQSGGNDLKKFQHGFTDVLKFLIWEMLSHAKDEIGTLRVNNYSSFVLQTALRLLVGNDEDLLQAILILLGCHEMGTEQGNFAEATTKQDIMALLEDTASTHLLEVIIEVAPETLYDELLNEVFKGSLYEISSHQFGNFVVQALVSSARTREQVELIWLELGPKLKELLEVGKSGVIASIFAACQRIDTYAHECCQALAAAVSSDPESSSCIVPRILFLDSYFRDMYSWKWPIGDKMHVLGCLILQTIFKYSSHFIQPYITSITSMEADQMYQTAQDAGGSHVLEAFLNSDASPKQKIKVITKLQGHFGELSMHPSSSFTVEKSFSASNLFFKETIAAELLAMQNAVSKTKHGPYLLKKLDIDGFSRQPEQWKLSQAAKEAAYKEFQATFGSDSKVHKQKVLVPQSTEKLVEKKRKRPKKSGEISRGLDSYDTTTTPSLDSEFPCLEISMAKSGFPGHEHGLNRGKSAVSTAKGNYGSKFIRNRMDVPFVRKPGKRKSLDNSFVRKSGKGKPSEASFVRKSGARESGARESSVTELADLAGKATLSAGDVRKLFHATTKSHMKESGGGKLPFLKKQRR